MNTTPIIVPVDTEKPKCPSCKKPENRIITCSHCGYRYPDGFTAKDFIIAVLIFSTGIWLLATMLTWMTSKRETLIDVLISQYEWIIDLFGRIW